MFPYLLVFLDAEGRVHRTQAMLCVSDAAAIASALAENHPFGLELWRSEQVVWKSKADESDPQRADG